MNKSNLITAFGLFVVLVLAIVAAERVSRKLDAAKLKREAEAVAAAAAAAAATANADTGV